MPGSSIDQQTFQLLSKMPLTVLSDSEVKKILNNLTKEEVETLQVGLRQSLHEYSTGTNHSEAAAVNQPKRTVLESNNGTTSLFMPSTSSTGIGMKGLDNFYAVKSILLILIKSSLLPLLRHIRPAKVQSQKTKIQLLKELLPSCQRTESRSVSSTQKKSRHFEQRLHPLSSWFGEGK